MRTFYEFVREMVFTTIIFWFGFARGVRQHGVRDGVRWLRQARTHAGWKHIRFWTLWIGMATTWLAFIVAALMAGAWEGVLLGGLLSVAYAMIHFIEEGWEK